VPAKSKKSAPADPPLQLPPDAKCQVIMARAVACEDAERLLLQIELFQGHLIQIHFWKTRAPTVKVLGGPSLVFMDPDCNEAYGEVHDWIQRAAA
jgi:hypothetical protein